MGILAMGRMMNASFTDYGFVLKDLREAGLFHDAGGHEAVVNVNKYTDLFL